MTDICDIAQDLADRHAAAAIERHRRDHPAQRLCIHCGRPLARRPGMNEGGGDDLSCRLCELGVSLGA